MKHLPDCRALTGHSCSCWAKQVDDIQDKVDIRDRIAEIIVPHLETETTDYGACYEDAIGIAEQILSLEIGGEVEEACEHCENGYMHFNTNLNPNLFPSLASVKCYHCHGTGKIKRKRTLRDVVGKGE